jgi:hypothetical protein
MSTRTICGTKVGRHGVYASLCVHSYDSFTIDSTRNSSINQHRPQGLQGRFIFDGRARLRPSRGGPRHLVRPARTEARPPISVENLSSVASVTSVAKIFLAKIYVTKISVAR